MTLRQWVDAAAKAGLATKAALLDFETGLVESAARADADGMPHAGVFADLPPETWDLSFRWISMMRRRWGLPPLGGR